ncbi:murein biosynthesis integral membrane protein MurJ [Brevundimonas bullata]|uniref:murein biosynthesis integral membrane protein MurJ n=1 Tax=Brevundimonas bullata TaxID=13160 RepID=UPI000E0C0110|nr:murein biosynthesis integral membrane protein MurJ [Brevundimonas bullata]WQE36617.1 murein biosynthesis integral membrane protein MurJ [Brevundimonas bullata]
MNDKTDPIEPAAPVSSASATVEPIVQPPAASTTLDGKAPRGGGVMRSSAIFSAMTLLSRLAGFARDVVISAALGASAGPAADAYNTALNFPNLFRRIFAEGAFAAAFVPAYAKTLKTEGQAVADQVATDALAAVAAVTVVLTILAQLTMPWLMTVINIGFLDDPARFKLAVILTQITMPYLPCMAVAALLSGVLNARGRFIVSGAYPILLNLIMLAAVIPAQGDQIGAAYAASWAVLVAGVAQAGLCWWAARKAGANIRLTMPRLTPAVKAIIITAVPAAIGNSATQINVFISGNLSSFVAGGRTWLATADRLYQLPLGLVGVAIGIALLPKLSAAVASQDHSQQQASMDEAVALSMALTLPAAAALMAMPYFLIDALFTRGAFLQIDAVNTAQALFQFGWGVPAFVLIRVLAPAFFARGDTRRPMAFSLISVAVNAALAFALMFGLKMGISGIAAAVSAAAWTNALLLGATLWRRGHYRPSPAAASRLVRILLASVGLGLVVGLASWARPLLQAPVEALLGALGADHGAKELTLLAVVAAGGLTYVVLAFATRAITVGEIKGLIRKGR